MRRVLTPSAVVAAASALLVSLVATVPMVVSGNIGRDSGVFLYTGMVISRGGMPYVDSWDHKGPLLAAIEAVAWRLGGGITGAPLLEGLVLFLGLALSGVLWSRRIGMWAAPVVLATGITYLAVFEGGNFTETWLFPVQLVAYSVVAEVAVRVGRTPSPRLATGVGALVGLALAVALFTRMNNAAGLIVLAAVVVVAGRRRFVTVLALVGVVGVIGAALMVWLWRGSALRAAIDQYLGYNLFYSQGTALTDRLSAFASLTQLLVSGAVVALLLIVIGAWAMRARGADAVSSRTGVVVALFVGVALVDSLSQLASGRPYPHYLVVTIAGFSVALVAALSAVRTMLPTRFPSRANVVATAIVAVAVVLSVSGSAATAASGLLFRSGAGVFVAGSYQAQIVDRVVAETSPTDRVLVHGAETWILAAAHRISPTSLTYALPVEQGYGGLPQQYFADITSRPPALIVEAPGSCGISTSCAPGRDHFGQLNAFVAGSYELEGGIVGFRYWRRVD